MLKVILDENRYEKDFVEKWTFGLDELMEHLREVPLDKVSEITWIEKDRIIEAARLFSRTKPSCIQWGNALEHTLNSFQCARALLILMAVTGNLEAPGGNVNRVPPPVMRPGELVQI